MRSRRRLYTDKDLIKLYQILSLKHLGFSLEDIKNIKFILRVMVIHVLTYCVCGVVFMALFDYEALYQLGNMKYFMHPVGSTSNFVGPVFQIVRGFLFGFILLLFRECVIQKKHGWLKLWAIIVVIGIINTPGLPHAPLKELFIPNYLWSFT